MRRRAPCLAKLCQRRVGEQDDWDRVPRKTFSGSLRGAIILHATSAQAVTADRRFIDSSNISLSCSGALARQSKASQIGVERFCAAVETVQNVPRIELLDARRVSPVDLTQSRTLGSLRSRASRGLGFGDASSAAINAVQCFASSRNTCRSDRTLSARANALSSTNSLRVLWLTSAALCKARFAFGVSRRSSFAVRLVRAGIR